MPFEVLGLISAVLWLIILIVNVIILLAWRDKRISHSYAPSISILIPAYNEEKYLNDCLNSVLSAKYPGEKEVIVIDDGSDDNTPQIVRDHGEISYIRTNRIGKAGALNKAIHIARNDVIITIDADSVLDKDALVNIVKPLRDKNNGASTGIIKVKNKKSMLTRFQNIEYLFFDLLTNIWDKANANIVVRGPISAFRKDVLLEIKGFDNDIDAMEDTAAAIKIIRAGYHVRVEDSSISYTNAPDTLRSFIRQRVRWAKGGVQLLKRNKDFYFKHGNPSKLPFPIFTYWYFNPIIFLLFFLPTMLSGYYNYFVLQGEFISLNAVLFFLNWFSLLGIANLFSGMLLFNYPFNFLNVSAIVMFVISYGFYAYSIKKYNARIDLKDIISLFFLFFYWIVINVIYLVTISQWLRPGSTGKNVWKK